MEKPIHVLAVDDEDSFTFFVKLNLQTSKERQFKVTTANSGTEGLKLAKVGRPDLILLDVMMPDMSGAEVAEELLLDARTKSIPIIFVTALVQKDEVDKEAGQMGGREFIAKPVSKDELISRIESTLGLN
ncbi:MAG: response regulator [Deltaproteobacteria bacterium]|nr:response regulator [Deltaproteobacteria bacterium]